MDDKQLLDYLMPIFSTCYKKFQINEGNLSMLQNDISHKSDDDISSETTAQKIIQQISDKFDSVQENNNSNYSEISEGLHRVQKQIDSLRETINDKNQQEFKDLQEKLNQQTVQLENFQRENERIKEDYRKLSADHQSKMLECDNLNQKNKNLQEKLNQQTVQLENFQRENERTKEAYFQLKSKMSEYADFNEFVIVKNCIDSLNETNRNYIKALCNGSNLLAFVSLGREESKINQLWHCLKDIAVKANADENEIKNLNTYFEFCIRVFNSVRPEQEQYLVREIELGSALDLNVCIKTADSKQIGNVQSVLTKCILSANGVVFKAIVKIG